VSLGRRVVSEALGSALLLAAVVGSGIMGEKLSGGSVGLALLANTIATGAALIVLILVFGPISGAHFNPAVTLALAWRREIPWRQVGPYLAAQVAGGILGVVLAHGMFGEALIGLSRKERAGGAQLLSEFGATFGLLATIRACSRTRPSIVPFAVGLYITSAYWFTASTSFANPAVTFARSLTDTFAGIRPSDVPGFVAAQLSGALAATALFGWLLPAEPSVVNRMAPLLGPEKDTA
jgi:glycerol uptake facilitator-like aquaporin